MEIFSFLGEALLRILPRIPEVLFNLLVGYLVIKFVVWVVGYFLKITQLPKLKGVALSILELVLWVLLIVLISNTLGFNKLALAISGSMVVLAFLLNNGIAPLVSDAISGIFLCTDGDFRVGSRVRVGKGENTTEGVIKEIDMRKVRIKDDDGNMHVLPNSLIDKDEWTVLTKSESHELVKKATVAKEKAKEIVRNKLGNNKRNDEKGA